MSNRAWLLIACLAFACKQDEPPRPVAEGLWLRPVVDQDEYVRFASRALAPAIEVQGVKSEPRVIQGVDEVHAQSNDVPRGLAITFVGPDIDTLETAVTKLREHPRAPQMPEHLQPVFTSHGELASMVFVDATRGFEVSSEATLSLGKFKPLHPIQVMLHLPDDQASELAAITQPRLTSRVALLSADETEALSVPVVPGPVTEGVLALHHAQGSAEQLRDAIDRD